MSTFAVQIYKNTRSNQPPAINLPPDLPAQELVNGELIAVAQQLFAEHGVLVIKDLFSKDLISELYQAFIARYQSYFQDQDYDDALKVGDKRQMLTVDFQKPFNHPAVYGNPLMLALMKELLGAEFVLGSFGVVISLPGAEDQHVHRDHPPLFEDDALTVNLPSFAITVVVPLVDLTPDTGSTRVWKGSHKISGGYKLPTKDSSVPFLSTGSCYLMDYRLLHGGTSNVSDLVRPILYIIYYRSWFQEAVNYEQQSRLSITQEEYDKIPQSLKFLFVRQREILRANHALERKLRRSSTQKSFSELTADEQAQQLEKLAETVLPQYGFQQASVQLISHGDNTVFSVKGSRTLSVDADDAGVDDRSDDDQRYVLRIHRAHYLSPQAIESELHWLNDLHHHTQIPIPKPLSTLTKNRCPSAQVLGMSEPRICSLTSWLSGRSLRDLSQAEQLHPQTLIAVGRLLGTLHHHTSQWVQPQSFTRPRWDWDGLFGSTAGYSDRGDRVWDLTPQPYRHLFETISVEVKKAMIDLGEAPDQFGLIHGDFWLGNLLIEGKDIGVIDFADCGFGYWGYDLVRFLNDFSEADYATCLENLLHGYKQVRSFPDAQLPYLNLFWAAQQATLALWRVNRAQDHPSFRATLETDLEAIAAGVQSKSAVL